MGATMLGGSGTPRSRRDRSREEYGLLMSSHDSSAGWTSLPRTPVRVGAAAGGATPSGVPGGGSGGAYRPGGMRVWRFRPVAKSELVTPAASPSSALTTCCRVVVAGGGGSGPSISISISADLRDISGGATKPVGRRLSRLRPVTKSEPVTAAAMAVASFMVASAAFTAGRDGGARVVSTRKSSAPAPPPPPPPAPAPAVADEVVGAARRTGGATNPVGVRSR